MTPDEINQLPVNVKAYIHHLEARCDPAGDVQKIASLEEQVKALTERLKEHMTVERHYIAAALSGLCANPRYSASSRSEIALLATDLGAATARL